MKKTAIIKLKCNVCGTEEKMKVMVHSFRQLFFVEVPPRYCGACFTELEQVIDGVEQKQEDENGG